jgi:DNA-binding PadR family transcriptional regulator
MRFGPHGPFGPNGPFGPGGPFGPSGPFGPGGPFGAGGPWGGGRDDDGRRGRKRAFESGELRLVLLKLIADEPRHGYDLIRAIEDWTHGSYAPSPGVVYPTLTLLEDMGLIAPASAEGSRKAYSATPEGRAYLDERAEEAEALMVRLSGFGDGRRKAGGAPIKRAVGNLMSAVWHSVTRDDAEEDTLHRIAEILDEAAQKIERLK